MHEAVGLALAVEKIPDGAPLPIGGFIGVGSPHRLIGELVRQGRKKLTVTTNETAPDVVANPPARVRCTEGARTP